MTTVRSSSYFAKATPPACQELSHLEDPCSCTGIIGCNSRIVSVDLSSRGLALDASQDDSLSLLSGLQHLVLENNSLWGAVPGWLMTGLSAVDLDDNHLTGTIPSQLAELTDLNELDIRGNHLNGTIPSQLAELAVLVSLRLQNNNLTGTIPSELAELTGLSLFDVNVNQLTGLVPSLPFKQYTGNCCLSPIDQQINHFTCPLPAGAADCKCNGSTGVVCQSI
jgi:Leucine-rich repeat (LRR) protein